MTNCGVSGSGYSHRPTCSKVDFRRFEAQGRRMALCWASRVRANADLTSHASMLSRTPFFKIVLEDARSNWRWNTVNVLDVTHLTCPFSFSLSPLGISTKTAKWRLAIELVGRRSTVFLRACPCACVYQSVCPWVCMVFGAAVQVSKLTTRLSEDGCKSLPPLRPSIGLGLEAVRADFQVGQRRSVLVLVRSAGYQPARFSRCVYSVSF